MIDSTLIEKERTLVESLKKAAEAVKAELEEDPTNLALIEKLELIVDKLAKARARAQRRAILA